MNFLTNWGVVSVSRRTVHLGISQMFLSLPNLSLPLLLYCSLTQTFTTSAMLLCFSVWSSGTCLPGYVYFLLFYIALPCLHCTFWTSYHTASTYIYFMWTIAVLLFDCYFVVSFHCWDALACVNSEIKLKEWILCTFSKNPLWPVYKLNVFYVTSGTSYMRDQTVTYPRKSELSLLLSWEPHTSQLIRLLQAHYFLSCLIHVLK